MAVVSEDVSNLRQGLKVLEQEMAEDSSNFILFISLQSQLGSKPKFCMDILSGLCVCVCP